MANSIIFILFKLVEGRIVIKGAVDEFEYASKWFKLDPAFNSYKRLKLNDLSLISIIDCNDSAINPSKII